MCQEYPWIHPHNTDQPTIHLYAFNAKIATIIKYHTFSYTYDLSRDESKPRVLVRSFIPSLHTNHFNAIHITMCLCAHSVFQLFTVRHNTIWFRTVHLHGFIHSHSADCVRINASQATLISCVVFYYYAIINFYFSSSSILSLILFSLENRVFETCYSINIFI